MSYPTIRNWQQSHQTGRKNAIINGNMNVWQRGTTIAVPAIPLGGSVFTADRWAIANKTSIGAMTVTSDTSVPNTSAVRSLKITQTTPYTPVDPFQWTSIQYKIEGYDVQKFYLGGGSLAKDITISFWVKSSLTGTYCLAIRNGPTITHRYLAEYTINTANTWEHKIITLSGPPSGTWSLDNELGCLLDWTLAVSPDTQGGPPGVWGTGAGIATSNQVNWCGGANTFFLTQVQMEVGSEYTGYEHLDFTTELVMCQRYYEKSYDLDVVPGTITEDGCVSNHSDDTGDVALMIAYKTVKRDSPTITTYSTSTGAPGYITRPGTGTNFAATPEDIGLFQSHVHKQTATPSKKMSCQWTAEAEL